jgi:hypothetical protein
MVLRERSSVTTPGVCSISSGTVTVNAQGICTVRASQAGNANYNAAADLDQSFTIGGLPQVCVCLGNGLVDFFLSSQGHHVLHS